MFELLSCAKSHSPGGTPPPRDVSTLSILSDGWDRGMAESGFAWEKLPAKSPMLCGQFF
jgi:hypothetical protein